MGSNLCACDQRQRLGYNLDVPVSPSEIYAEYYQSGESKRRLEIAAPEETDKTVPLALNKALEKLKTGIEGKRETAGLKPASEQIKPSPPPDTSQRYLNTSTSYQEEQTVAFSLTDPQPESLQTAEIRIEGALLKYKPGLSTNFVPRWCQLTSTQFRYYKNQWQARVWEHKPLFSVSLKHILSVKRYRPTPDEKIRLFSATNAYLFHVKLTEEASRCLTPERKSEDASQAAQKSRQTWSSRSQEWATQRLLFCAKSAEEMRDWVAAFPCKQ